MTKSDLVAAMATIGEIPRAKAEQMFNAMLERVTNALKSRERVVISGFGTFSVRESKARTGRNPKTGETIHIAAKAVPKFTPGKELKSSISGS
ncbi:MAG: DNA-binding protein HU [Candidatus Tectomicrobia bacterium RIFCSPLOWO2_12_FULL_69_37]|nr:MAG: DNA-binding protein HU [Candidatus Tectomicrobia bacterium RIFCSPLOWO2_02_FULL_70_19]OGL66837.1 MAG: DNA-binding protein HU [Candidatus Tectomicrobia bacterium RIFCSPLOWO2_12_FULL_69_37]